MHTQKIVPCLWFDNNAQEAMDLYLSVFQNSKILKVKHHGKEGPGPEGTVLVGTFEIAGQTFMALNGGPLYKFNEAISLLVNCETQQEVDQFWEKLSAGGEKGQCGWLKDKFGVSWQIVPRILEEMLSDANPGRSGRVLKALWQMTKINVAALERAYGNP